jgi:hypothetical protein
MDPVTAAVHDMITTSSKELRETIAGLDENALNRAPAPETNAISVLVAHAVSATCWLVDAALTGQMDRGRYLREDRSAAFATRDAEEDRLLAIVDNLDRLLDRLAAEGPSVDYAGSVTYTGAEQGPARTRAWSLIHAAEHLREHVGHAQLTRQLVLRGR